MVDGTLGVDARQVDGVVRVTVSDQGRWRAPLDRGGGRGLTIVRAVVDTLSIDSDEEGTRAQIERVLTSPRVAAEVR
jgi:anti-sigma regulatory factor (Ser/Thr protein kinase)